MNPSALSRRKFLAIGGATLIVPKASRAAEFGGAVGQGDFRYRMVPGWGNLGEETPVKNCHGIVCDAAGNIILLTDEVRNNVIIYSPSGQLLHKWGTAFPGAHGLSLVTEGSREVLYFTDTARHMVFKATTSGEMLGEWKWPEATGKYKAEGEYRPSWTLHLRNGDFFTLDGYGKDYITRHGADGKFKGIFGGQEGGIPHWGPHGGMIDTADDGTETLLIAMSDQQSLFRLNTEGKRLSEIPFPGGNPRQIRKFGDHYLMAHLADNWPADRASRGFVSILDKDFRVVSNIAGTPPEYDDDGKLRKMAHKEDIFLHPHDIITGKDGSLYVAQHASNNTYPLKLERI